MIGLVGVIVMAAVSYVVLKKLLTGRSWLFWLFFGFIVLVFLAQFT